MGSPALLEPGTGVGKRGERASEESHDRSAGIRLIRLPIGAREDRGL